MKKMFIKFKAKFREKKPEKQILRQKNVRQKFSKWYLCKKVRKNISGKFQ